MQSGTCSRHLIRIARRQSGVSQGALAQRVGTSRAAMSAYGSGRRSPSVDTLCRIVGATGFEMRLATPDGHEAALHQAESGPPPDQITAHDQRERARLARRAVRA